MCVIITLQYYEHFVTVYYTVYTFGLLSQNSPDQYLFMKRGKKTTKRVSHVFKKKLHPVMPHTYYGTPPHWSNHSL